MKFLTGFVWIDPTHYVDLARSAEAAGWDGIVLSDHLVHLEEIATPYPYAEGGQRPWLPRWRSPRPAAMWTGYCPASPWGSSATRSATSWA